ncbi:membrane hypothetical protein [Flavobacterium psychrophilum]|uniref:hypothetical protein n=1 Tax=Flavobacterium psychrophilum TaxID=96345 RepID=UPI000B7C09EA|nr:hypothetical protein [Flavobacterium psychrophilum]SNB22475.1 membrane hypothetical protein [Flavobacterium psychrophilum]
MIDTLIKFHQTNLTVNGLLKARYLITYNLLNIVFILLLLIGYYFFVINLKSENWFCFLFIVVPIILYFFFRRKLLTKIKKDLKINKSEFSIYFLQELDAFIKENKLIDNESEIINNLEDKLKRIKDAFLFESGVISALSLIGFNSFCSKIYDFVGNDLRLFALVTLLLFSCIYLFVLTTFIFRNLYETFYTQYFTINSLINMLKDNQFKRSIKNSPTKQM